ncbi:hypothetical protein C0Z18_12215 [Trinickia dabaoshanensis]|uniref:Uncharacterized protein n=1 Tax=Trinickia dabaoshanensis TaxID=564714 RepID=A0A2N7VSN2_9BURK|nr:hypothetical protein C0Z18_12215 [Trinickia dabaoshanensis]
MTARLRSAASEFAGAVIKFSPSEIPQNVADACAFFAAASGLTTHAVRRIFDIPSGPCQLAERLTTGL